MADQYDAKSVSNLEFIRMWKKAETFREFVENWTPNDKNIANADAEKKKAQAANKATPTGGTARGQLEKVLKLRRTNINQQIKAMGLDAEMPAKLDMRASKKLTAADVKSLLAAGDLRKTEKKKK